MRSLWVTPMHCMPAVDGYRLPPSHAGRWRYAAYRRLPGEPLLASCASHARMGSCVVGIGFFAGCQARPTFVTWASDPQPHHDT
ncbi:hypothetical protein XFF6992_280039 [Xanthomonas citri pv. fuscans]|nr:hypothetical protein XFF6992_280039 [Xanthomonas citri pv. fuscans]SOO32963.1 hypothetical protein XFF6994_2500009 [Xanthomonas citri pv. fuscans]